MRLTARRLARRWTVVTLLAATTAVPCVAEAAPEDGGGRLVYVFSLDGLDGDRVDAGRAPYLKRLLAGEEGGRATYYPESRSVMVAETNPNHVAMATGAFGETSGIPGNAFRVYGDAARGACAAGDDGVTDGEVATCLQAETFFAAAKRQAPAATTTAAIMGKPKLAQLFAGQTVDPNASDADYLWTPCEPLVADNPPYCRTTGRPTDGYAISDELVMDATIDAVENGVPADGTRKRPNLTFVNFPTIDANGHVLGTETGAYDASIAAADGQLARFVANQKRLGIWERTVVLVVSDHSMEETPTKTSLGRRFDADGLADGVTIVQNGSVDMVYLDDRDRPDRDEFLRRLRASALTEPGVDEALYRLPNAADGGDAHTLDRTRPGWRIAGERTGDLFVTHRPGGSFSDPVNPLPGNHGAPQTTDNFFAVVSGGSDVVQQTVAGTVGERFDDTLVNTDSAQNVDVAPTAMALLGLQPPARSQGRVLTEAFAPGALPAAVAAPAASCSVTRATAAWTVRPAGRRGLRVALGRGARGRVTVDVVRQSAGRRLAARRVLRVRRLAPVTLRRPRGGDGIYVVALRGRADGRAVQRRFVLRRSGGRFRTRPAYRRAPSCGLLRGFRLDRAAFGGRGGRALGVAFRLRERARVRVDLLRGGRVVRRLPARTRAAGTLHRLQVPAAGLRRGLHVVRLSATAGERRATARLASTRR